MALILRRCRIRTIFARFSLTSRVALDARGGCRSREVEYCEIRHEVMHVAEAGRWLLDNPDRIWVHTGHGATQRRGHPSRFAAGRDRTSRLVVATAPPPRPRPAHCSSKV